MLLKKSIHYNDAVQQIASNGLEIINKYARKWNVAETLIAGESDKVKAVYYLDGNGRLIYMTHDVDKNILVVGVRTIATEKVNVEW